MTNSVVSIMGQELDRELQDRGIFSLGRRDCEAIMARVIERTAALEPATREAGGSKGTKR